MNLDFSVQILGNNSATPAFGRHPSAQFILLRNIGFLIDCGEGTQIQFLKYHVKKGKLKHIFISHLHGDHYLGLPGLLDTLQLGGRTQDLYIYAPPALFNLIQVHTAIAGRSYTYPLHFIPIEQQQSPYTILNNQHLSVSTIPLQHGAIACTGFLFTEKPLPANIISSKIKEYKISHTHIPNIKQGSGYTTVSGQYIPHQELTTPPPPPRSYAYCSDTAYYPPIIPQISNASLLYHEATYSHDLAILAQERGHSNALQAAQIAKSAGVKKLLIGHFSSRYQDLSPLLHEAQAHFPNTEIATEGKIFNIPLNR